MRLSWRSLVVGGCLASSLAAQGRGLTVTASPTVASFGRWGQFGAAALAARHLRGAPGPLAIEWSLVAVLPLGSFYVTPLCPPAPAGCVTEYRSPLVLTTALVGVSRSLGVPWLRGAVGAGAIAGPGAAGGATWAGALEAGVDATWTVPGGRPPIVASLRGMVLSRDIVEMRTVLVPGIGLRF